MSFIEEMQAIRNEQIISDPKTSEESKAEIRAYLEKKTAVMFAGSKRKNAVILTEAEDKGQRLSRHAESNLQIKCCKWVSKWYPDDRLILHKREGLRVGFNRASTLTLNKNSDNYPDHEFKCSTSIKIMLIEFKRPDRTWATKAGRIKADCKCQYLMHCQLWKEGQITYFCNDFDKFRELYKAFKSGNPFPQQIYTF